MKELIMIIEFSNILGILNIKNILLSVTPAEEIVTRFISSKANLY